MITIVVVVAVNVCMKENSGVRDKDNTRDK